MAYWIGVACSNHVAKGVKDGFAQLGHGKHSAVKALKKDDWLIYYSPTTELGGGEKVQSFTAIGQITSEEPYEASMGEFKPFRVDVNYLADVQSAPIRPMLEQLSLTKDKGSKWGMVVRTSRIKCPQKDAELIAKAMGSELSFSD